MNFSGFILIVIIPLSVMVFNEIAKVRKQYPLSYPMRLMSLLNVVTPFCIVMIIAVIASVIAERA